MGALSWSKVTRLTTLPATVPPPQIPACTGHVDEASALQLVQNPPQFAVASTRPLRLSSLSDEGIAKEVSTKQQIASVGTISAGDLSHRRQDFDAMDVVGKDGATR